MRGSIARKSLRSVSCASSAIWPAISTPVGPAPTTTNVSQRGRRAGSASASAASKRAGCGRGCGARLERLELRRVLAPVVVAEARVAGAARDDERVVRERAAASPFGSCPAGPGAPRGRSRRPRRAGRATLRAASGPPAADRDLGRRQRAGRHLIRERLEEVEVPPVDERDLDRRPGTGRQQPAESASDDDHPMSRSVH